MKIGQITAAYPALQRFYQAAAMDFKESYAIKRLLSDFKDDVDYCIEKELEILKKYGIERESEPGRYYIPIMQDRITANKELNVLRDVESKVIFEKIKIYPDDLKMKMPDGSLVPFKITGQEIDLLEPFINFVFENKEKSNEKNKT